MTEQKHVQHPTRAASFCGKDGQGFAPLEDLEGAKVGEVCPVCVSQIVEVEAHGPARFAAYVWPVKDARVLSQTFASLHGVHAYRLMICRLLEDVGDSMGHFTYSRA